MEGQVNDVSESSNDISTSGVSAGKHSSSSTAGTSASSDISVSYSTQSEPRTRNLSRDLDVVELSSDEEVQIIDVKGQQPASEKATERDHNQAHSSGRTSPKDVTCSVCLCEYDNKAFLDQCFHAFCYFCILQWSEIVRTCPLCKSSFSSIIHSVKSMDNYQQHYLSKPDDYATQQSQSDGRRFRYRTTVTEGREGSRQQQQSWGQQQQMNEIDAWEQRTRRRQAHIATQSDRKAMGRERRRTIYSNNLWVQGVTQAGRARQREISPEFFRTNPACSHRLIPWLTRDLRVLLNDVESHVKFVLQIILSLITKVELSSEEFYNQLHPFLFDKTEQFIHEFISFARSPFDVTAYDERAQYSRPNESHEEVRDTPTVFHSETSGWQTPVPGPSGESMLEMSQADWSRDSPVLPRESTSWSPSSSPGTSGLNEQPSLVGTVTVSSASSQTVLANAFTERSGSDEPGNHGNALSPSKGSRNRSKSISETVTIETSVESRHKHKHSHHYHRHSHKNKHKHKHKKKRAESQRHNTSKNSGQVIDSLDYDSDQLKPVSIDSSLSGLTPPLEVIVVTSDSIASPDSSNIQHGATNIDLTKSQRNKTRSVAAESCSRSRSFPKGKGILHGENRSRSRCDHAESRSSRDRSSVTRERTRQDNHQSRSRSRSRLKERYHSKNERRLQTDDRDDLSNLELFSSRTSGLKKEKRHREKRRSRSGSRGRSRSHSNAKSVSKTGAKKFDKKKIEYSRSRSPSGSSIRHEAPSCSRKSRSRNSRSRNSRSRNSRSRDSISRNSRSRNSRSRSRSKCFSRARSSRSPRNHADSLRDSRSRNSSQSTVHSESDPTKDSALSNSSEDIKKEIEDLEFRITSDKKRLLKLLIKQERTKAVVAVDLEEESENAPQEDDEGPG